METLTGVGETGRDPEKRQVKGVQGVLRCASVQSDRRSGLFSARQRGSFGSETNRPGAVGPSGLCDPQ